MAKMFMNLRQLMLAEIHDYLAIWLWPWAVLVKNFRIRLSEYGKKSSLHSKGKNVFCPL